MAVLTLGILAGGLGTRAGQLDKALLTRNGITQLERFVLWAQRFNIRCLINSNRRSENYSNWPVSVIADRLHLQGQGPAAGIISLLDACETNYLLTLPIDIEFWPDDWHQKMLDVLRSAESNAVFCKDANGLQPLCAAWRVAACKQWVEVFLQKHDWAIHSLVQHPNSKIVEFPDLLFGNLNTLNDYDPL